VSAIPKQQQLFKNSHKLRQRKCKECKKWFTPINEYQICCCPDCAIAYNEVKKAKQKRKAIKQFRETDKAILTKKAQTVFNKYIRLRDKDQPCISCGHIGNRQRHAGHFMPVGSNSHVRFDEANCHSQCSICNNHKSGNLVEYEKNLLLKIGEKELSRIKKKVIKNWTIDELKEIIEKYTQKIKDIS